MTRITYIYIFPHAVASKDETFEHCYDTDWVEFHKLEDAREYAKKKLDELGSPFSNTIWIGELRNRRLALLYSSDGVAMQANREVDKIREQLAL